MGVAGSRFVHVKRTIRPQGRGPPRGEPQQGGPQLGEPLRGGPHRGVPLWGGPHRGEPPRRDPPRNEPQRGEPQGCGARQAGNLVITPDDEPEITVDNIEVAQFVYLLLHNAKIRDVIDTIGRKGVLLLGRFTEGRITILERLREKLRSLGFVPMVFNFDKPETKDFTETVRLLANLSHFVIVDITNPRSTPLELQATVPGLHGAVRPDLRGRAGSVRNVRRPSNQIRLGARTCNCLSVSRPADRVVGGQDR
jgi:hypothetical protein